jgi:ferredoxin-NADP reductase
MNARLLKIDHPAARTLGFVIQLDQPIAFRAGQSCDLTLVNPRHQDAKGSTRTFSITSAPSESPRLMFATRQTDSAFKRSLEETAIGSTIEVDGPWGTFVLHDDPARPAVLLAGGIGVTPFRSMIKDAVERRLAHAITLIHSNHSRAAAAFFSDFETWSHVKRNFTFVPTVTEPSPAGAGSPVRVGAIDAALIAQHRGTLAAPMYYVAGPAGFVSAMRKALFEAGVRPSDTQAEEFPGY